jgi:hypothetical protein
LQSITFNWRMPPAEEQNVPARFIVRLAGHDGVPKPPELAKRGGCWFESGSVQIHLGVESDFRPAKKAHPGAALPPLRCPDCSDCAIQGFEVNEPDEYSLE